MISNHQLIAIISTHLDTELVDLRNGRASTRYTCVHRTRAYTDTGRPVRYTSSRTIPVDHNRMFHNPFRWLNSSGSRHICRTLVPRRWASKHIGPRFDYRRPTVDQFPDGCTRTGCTTVALHCRSSLACTFHTPRRPCCTNISSTRQWFDYSCPALAGQCCCCTGTWHTGHPVWLDRRNSSPRTCRTVRPSNLRDNRTEHSDFACPADRCPRATWPNLSRRDTDNFYTAPECH